VFGRVVGDGLHLSDASVFAREIRNGYLDQIKVIRALLLYV